MPEYELRKNDEPILFYHPAQKSVMLDENVSIEEIRVVLIRCLKYIDDWDNKNNGYKRYKAIIDVGNEHQDFAY